MEIVEVMENDLVMDVVSEIVNDIEDVDVAVCVWDMLTEMLVERLALLLLEIVAEDGVCDNEVLEAHVRVVGETLGDEVELMDWRWETDCVADMVEAENEKDWH